MITLAVVGSTNERGHPSRRSRVAGSFLAANACHKSPKLRPVVERNKLATLLGAEDNMNKVLYVCVGHFRSFLVESLPRLWRSEILIRLPTALPWAKLPLRLRRVERRVRVRMRSAEEACQQKRI
jgi:hypothetical protein